MLLGFLLMSALIFWRQHPPRWIGRTGNTRSFWACTWQSWVGALRAIAAPTLAQGCCLPYFSVMALCSPPFPLSSAPYGVAGTLARYFSFMSPLVGRELLENSLLQTKPHQFLVRELGEGHGAKMTADTRIFPFSGESQSESQGELDISFVPQCSAVGDAEGTCIHCPQS